MSSKAELRRFVRDLKRGTDSWTSKKNMRLIAERAIQLIVRRTQKGFGVKNNNGQEIPLKALSSVYIEQRKRQRKLLDGTTSPIKSNLTFTGQMLRSMTVKEITNKSVSIGPNKRRRKGGLTNEQIAEYVQKERPFNNLSFKEINAIVKFMDEVLQLEIIKV